MWNSPSSSMRAKTASPKPARVPLGGGGVGADHAEQLCGGGQIEALRWVLAVGGQVQGGHWMVLGARADVASTG